MAPNDRGQALVPISLARPAEVAAAGRLGDLLLAAEVHESDLPPVGRRGRREGLRVVYLSAPVELGGRERVLLDQAERLAAAGAEVTVLWRGRAPADPPARASVVEVPFGSAFCDLLPPCDLVIAGCWDLVLPARRLGVAPVALLEQGDLATLGDVPVNLSGLIGRALRAAARIWCVDPLGRRQLAERYGVSAFPLPGGAPETGEQAPVGGHLPPEGWALRGQCEAIVEALPPDPGSEPGCLVVDDLPLGPDELDRLRFRAATSPTRDLLVPVSQPAIGPLRVVRWRVVGHRSGARPGETRLWVPLRAETPVRDAWHQEGLDLLRAGRLERAVRRFAAACEAGGQAEQAVAGRWLVLSLLAAGRPAEAAELAGAFARDFPTHPDYLYLVVVAAREAGRPIDVVGPVEALRLLGEGGQYDEWFEDPYGLLLDQLATGWPGLGALRR